MTSWTTPLTWTDGSTPSASNLNTHVRDNMLHLYENLDWQFGFPAAGEPSTYFGNESVTIANRVVYQRVRGAGTIANLGIHVGTSAGNISAAVYADNDADGEAAAPYTRSATSGSVACPASGFSSVNLATSLTVGAATHWFALSASSASATFHANATQTTEVSVARGAACYQENGHPAPATAEASSPTHAYLNMVGIA